MVCTFHCRFEKVIWHIPRLPYPVLVPVSKSPPFPSGVLFDEGKYLDIFAMFWPLRIVFTCFCVLAISAFCSAQIDLGAAEAYGILGRLSVTNTGSTVIVGDLGTGGTSVTGFYPPGIVNGSIIKGDATGTAFIDATSAFLALNASSSALDLTGVDLVNLSLPPGSYEFNSSAQLTGKLTLVGNGNPDAEWHFKMGSSLTTGAGSSVVLANGASSCRVYWAVGSSATLGTGTSFAGTIIAAASVTFVTDAVLTGRAFGMSATLRSNYLVIRLCGEIFVDCIDDDIAKLLEYILIESFLVNSIFVDPVLIKPINFKPIKFNPINIKHVDLTYSFTEHTPFKLIHCRLAFIECVLIKHICIKYIFIQYLIVKDILIKHLIIHNIVKYHCIARKAVIFLKLRASLPL
ncbi:hypothetical protein VTL71DRAFT_7453 [Oculimacula yallundae]|uniref:Ice-binding protein n=1 Tax=Oculimacula yallundae TaxID=86028 RepID=A0ABR4BU58_9HELO